MQEWAEEIIELKPLPGCGRAFKTVLDKATDVFNAIYGFCFRSREAIIVTGAGYYFFQLFSRVSQRYIIKALSYQEYFEKGVEFGKCMTLLQNSNCNLPENALRDFANTIHTKELMDSFWLLYEATYLFYLILMIAYFTYGFEERNKIQYQLQVEENDASDKYLEKLMELGLDKEKDLRDLSMEFLDQVLNGDIDKICFISKTGMLADLSTVKKFKKCPVTGFDIDPETDLVPVYGMDDLKLEIERLFLSLEGLITEKTLKTEHDPEVSSLQMIEVDDDEELSRNRGEISFFKRIKYHIPEVLAVGITGAYFAFDLHFKNMSHITGESELNKYFFRQGILKGRCDNPTIIDLACQAIKVNAEEEANLLQILSRYNRAQWFYNLFLYIDYVPITSLVVFLSVRKFFVETVFPHRGELFPFWKEKGMRRENPSSESLYDNVSSVHADNRMPPLKNNILYCPITREPIIKPMLVLTSSHVYEKDAIQTWVNNQPEEDMSCPVTSIKINDKSELVPILNLRYFHEALEAKLKKAEIGAGHASLHLGP